MDLVSHARANRDQTPMGTPPRRAIPCSQRVLSDFPMVQSVDESLDHAVLGVSRLALSSEPAVNTTLHRFTLGLCRDLRGALHVGKRSFTRRSHAMDAR